ncbi:MAG: hypothetical protein ABI321_07465 [Polyangia bacterium]
MPDEKNVPPLMSSSSPSYERAQKEAKHPSDVGPAQQVAVLEQLFEAEDNGRLANLRAASSLKDPTEAETRAEGHAAHQQALAGMITALGGAAPREGETRQLLAHGVDDVARAAGDSEINEALRLVEDDLGKAYSTALADPHLDDAQREALGLLAPT